MMRQKIQIIALIFGSFYSTYGTVRNVPANFATIQSALNACLIGDTVLVDTGIYYENIIWPNMEDIKLLSVGDSSNTIIDGNQTGRVLTFNDSIIIGNNTRINGFQIRNGSTCNGPGIWVANSSPIFEKVSINNNHTFSYYDRGGGVYLKNSNSIFLSSSIYQNFIDSATSGRGGGIYIEEGAPYFEGINISENHCASTSWGNGGGVYLENSSAIFKKSSISHNHIDTAKWGHGGGIAINMGTILLEDVDISFNNIRSNAWNYGNGIYAIKSNIDLTNVIISSNSCDSTGKWYKGGGGYFEDCDCSMFNCLLHSNVIASNGIYGNGTALYVIYSANISPSFEIVNTTISNNLKGQSMNQATAIICEDCVTNSINIKNSICYNSTNYAEFYDPASVNVAYSDIRGGFAGPGNIDFLPNFISTTDYHFNAASPCMNSANIAWSPAFDLDNGARPLPLGTNPDMGCYESPLLYSGVQSESLNSIIVIYPNPATESQNIEISSSKMEPLTIELLDMVGKKLSSVYQCYTVVGNQILTFNLKTLPSGTYQYKIQVGEDLKSVRIYKQ
nr:T9SS type A sorting domain-containing protein [Chitinophagaceae bacterium]